MDKLQISPDRSMQRTRESTPLISVAMNAFRAIALAYGSVYGLGAILTLFWVSGCIGSDTSGTMPSDRAAGPIGSVRIVLVGDTLLGDAAQKYLDRYGYDYPFRQVAARVAGHGLLVGNLEGPITTNATPLDANKTYLYKMNATAARALSEFGFDVFCLANNHILDYGTKGLTDTLGHLDKLSIGYFGAGRNRATAERGHVVTVAGRRIGFIGLMRPYGPYRTGYDYFAGEERPGVAPLIEPVARSAIKGIRKRADTVIVWVHWGRNYMGVSDSQRSWAKKLAQWGADIVVGHHPHVAQGVQLVDGVPVFYSLGNFAFGTPGRFHKVHPLERYGWIATLIVDKEGVNRAELVPISTDNRVIRFQPLPAKPGVLPGILDCLNTSLGTEMEVSGDKAILRIPRASSTH